MVTTDTAKSVSYLDLHTHINSECREKLHKIKMI